MLLTVSYPPSNSHLRKHGDLDLSPLRSDNHSNHLLHRILASSDNADKSFIDIISTCTVLPCRAFPSTFTITSPTVRAGQAAAGLHQDIFRTSKDERSAHIVHSWLFPNLSGTSCVILNSPDVVSANRIPTPHILGAAA